MTEFCISRNYNDRTNPLAWLVYDTEKGPNTAKAVANLIAKNVQFKDSSTFEKIGGCQIIAVVDSSDLQIFDQNVNVPELVNPEKLSYNNADFYNEVKDKWYDYGDSIGFLRLLSDGSMTEGSGETVVESEETIEASESNKEVKTFVGHIAAITDRETILSDENYHLYILKGNIATPIIINDNSSAIIPENDKTFNIHAVNEGNKVIISDDVAVNYGLNNECFITDIDLKDESVFLTDKDGYSHWVYAKDFAGIKLA